LERVPEIGSPGLLLKNEFTENFLHYLFYISHSKFFIYIIDIIVDLLLNNLYR